MCVLTMNSLYSRNNEKEKQEENNLFQNHVKQKISQIWVMLGIKPDTSALEV